MEARFLQVELQRLMGEETSRLFLDSDDLRDLTLLGQHVRMSKCLLLVQTPEVLQRPYCLIELATAIDSQVPIIGITVGKAYDFSAATKMLTHLDTMLEQVNPGAEAILAANGIADLPALAHKLATTIPNIISIEFNSSASRNIINATLSDIRDAMASAEPAILPLTKDEFLATRGSPWEVPKAAYQHGKFAPPLSLSRAASHAIAATALGGRAPFKVATGHSTNETTADAVAAAVRQLTRKLAGAPLTLVIGCVSTGYPVEEIAPAFQASLPAGCKFLATSSYSNGVITDGSWKEACDSTAMLSGVKPTFIALQGFSDPDGVYSVMHAAHSADVPMWTLDINYGSAAPWGDFAASQAQLVERVSRETAEQAEQALAAGRAEATAKKLVANFARAAPHFAFGFTSHAYPDAAIASLMRVVGVELPIAGGGAGTPLLPQFIVSCNGVGTHEPQASLGTPAFGAVLCWPTVHVAGAFCSGLTPNETADCTGTITKVAGQHAILEIDGEPAMDVYRRWLPSLSEAVIAKSLQRAKQTVLPGMPSTEDIYGKGYLGLMEMIALAADDALSGSPDEEGYGEMMAAVRDSHVKGGLTPSIYGRLRPLGLQLGEHDGDAYYAVAFPSAMGSEDKAIYTMVAAKEGQRVLLMDGKSADARERTARIARQVLRAAGFDHTNVAGCYSYNCGMYQMLGGPRAMASHAEKLAEAVGDVPTLGMTGGPEFGTMGVGSASAVGSYMYSAIVFSTISIDEPMHRGVTFASGAADGVGASMLVNRSGTFMLDDNEAIERSTKMSGLSSHR